MRRVIEIDELKKIASSICKEENISYGKDYKINAVTPKEFYRDYLLKKPYRLLVQPMFYLVHPFVYGGYNDLEDGIVIYTKKLKSDDLKENNMALYNFIFSCYHEIRHSVQHEFSKYSYESFLRSVEGIIRILVNNFDYSFRHNDYSFEIGANLYSTAKARLYMQKNYPEEYSSIEEQINQIMENILKNYFMYDALYTIDGAFRCIKMNRYNLENIKELVNASVLPMFINKDYSFKSISEIMDNEETKKLDKRIIYSVLASSSYKKNINILELSQDEKKLLDDATEYFATIKENQKNYEENHSNNSKKKQRKL